METLWEHIEPLFLVSALVGVQAFSHCRGVIVKDVMDPD